MKSFLLAIVCVILLDGADSQAERKASLNQILRQNSMDAHQCDGRPDFITEVRPEMLGGFEKLPSLILVAHEADYYVEAKNGSADVRVHSYQSFAHADSQGQSKIVCGTAKNLESNRFALFAPTLIDTTHAQKVGQSLWQFQMVTDKKGFAVWNQRSLASSDRESLERNVLEFGGNYRIYQLGAKLYEVVISKEENGVIQYLSVKYDAINSI
jgi:hypothetical protein